MGDAADDILNGDVDEVTGEWLGNGDGYPRTMTRRNTHQSGIFRQSQRLIDHFPDLTMKVLQGHGLNVYTGPAGIITIWWQKGKWVNSKNNKWQYFRDYGKAELEMIAIIEGHIDPPLLKPVKAIVSAPIVGTGTQQCIEHINTKISKIEVAKGNYAVITMLKTVAAELEQYL